MRDNMIYEKSCGAIVFRKKETIEYLIILNKKGNAKGHWGFPKGHTEDGEGEHATAVREIFEETGLSPAFIDGFRTVSRYSPREGVLKEAVYFLAEASADDVKIQKSELADYRWCGFSDAEELLTFDKELLKEADDFLKK